MIWIHRALEGASALFAIAAAYAWWRASLKPVAKSGPGPYVSADPNHPMWEAMRKAAAEVERGAELNRRAALLTAAAAAFQAGAAITGWLVA